MLTDKYIYSTDLLFFDQDTQPEQRLWLSVLTKFAIDARAVMRMLHKPPRIHPKKKRKRDSIDRCLTVDGLKTERRQIICHLYNDWTRDVCEMAGVDPKWFRKQVLKILFENKPECNLKHFRKTPRRKNKDLSSSNAEPIPLSARPRDFR
jgi:hypothetical protein